MYRSIRGKGSNFFKIKVLKAMHTVCMFSGFIIVLGDFCKEPANGLHPLTMRVASMQLAGQLTCTRELQKHMASITTWLGSLPVALPISLRCCLVTVLSALLLRCFLEWGQFPFPCPFVNTPISTFVVSSSEIFSSRCEAMTLTRLCCPLGSSGFLPKLRRAFWPSSSQPPVEWI